MTAFFPTYKDNWTRTPNVFFDKILTHPKANLNQVRLIGYLIRKTLGYNQEAKWTGVSRSELINKAGIPNSRIKEAIQGCEKNNWILTYEEGTGTRKKRYIFLNDDRNQRIVIGLKKGLFTIQDLEYLNLAGIEKLLSKYQIATTPETGEEQTFPTPETGEATTPETGEATTPETGEADSSQSQESQGFDVTLNTNNKYNTKYNNNVVVLKNQIEERFNQEVSKRLVKKLIGTFEKHGKKNIIASLSYVIEKFKETFGRTLSIKEAHAVLASVFENGADFNEALNTTTTYFKQRGEFITNPVGALLNTVENGFRATEQKTKREWRPYDVVDPTVLLIKQRIKEVGIAKKIKAARKEGELS